MKFAIPLLALALTFSPCAHAAGAYVAKVKKPGREKAHPSDALFATNAPILRFTITIASNELAKLEKDVRSYVRAKVSAGGTAFADVGVHLKGNGSFRPLSEKPSLVVKFDRYVPDQEFLGLTKIALNNSSQDGTFLADYMANSLFMEANVPAGRVTHARVELNGRDLGLYVLVESHNKEFLKRWFGHSKGNLYEAYLQDVDQQIDQDHGDDTSQRDRKRLAEVVKIPDAKERWAKLHETLDVDRYVTHLVCELFTGHTDGYAMNRNNYRIYSDPETGRFTFIGHGVDWAYQNTGVSITRPPLGSLVTKAVLTTWEGDRLFKERRGTLFTNHFQLEALTNRVNMAVARLVGHAVNTNEAKQFLAYGREMNNRLVARWQNLTNQLYAPPALPLAFNTNGIAKLGGWYKKAEQQMPSIVHLEATNSHRRTLGIGSTNGPFIASWRTRIVLTQGQYVFEGLVRTAGVLVHTNETGLGAGLRISGDKRQNKVLGETDFTPVHYDISVDVPDLEVELVAEVRAMKGEAWFDADSLRIRRK